MENSLVKKLKDAKSINADSASAYQEFCSNHSLKLQVVPSVSHNNGQINIAEINGVHSQLKTWLSKFRGASTRHPQEYLNWFTYIFIIKNVNFFTFIVFFFISWYIFIRDRNSILMMNNT